MKNNHHIIVVASVLCCLLLPPSTTAFLPLHSPSLQRSASRSRHHQQLILKSLRATSSSANINEDESPRTLIQKGMQSFRSGDVSTSLQYFDRANDLVPDNKLTPYLWQRGISYYYLDQFKEGHEQFSLDVRVNPLDVEEIVWDIACLARIDKSKFPVENQMALPNGKKDSRKIMSTVYSLFRNDGATEYDLREAGHNGSTSDEFYSLFYLGLYCEIRGEESKAHMYMKMAERSKYATGVGSGDYMSACARVHCMLRGWV